ncbi:hypothetical protein NKG05_22120 [Oerskovia sp. M15]
MDLALGRDVEQAQMDGARVGGEHRDVDAVAGKVDAERRHRTVRGRGRGVGQALAPPLCRRA